MLRRISADAWRFGRQRSGLAGCLGTGMLFAARLFVAGLWTGVASGAPLSNGDFSAAGQAPEPFAMWTTELTLGDRPSDGGGTAVFTVSDLPEAQQLEQSFNLPAGAVKLSFEVRIETGYVGPVGFLDSFQVTLFGDGFVPLLPYNEFSPAFYSAEPFGHQLYDEAFVIVDVTDGLRRVELDVSSLSTQDVLLEFLLIGGADGRQTKVTLDNVEITIVPEPSAGSLCVSLAVVMGGTQLLSARRRGKRKARSRNRRPLT